MPEDGARRSDSFTPSLRRPRQKSVGSVRPPGEDRELTLVVRAQLDAFLAAHDESVISTSRIINPLLDLWDFVHNESPDAARPIERLLTVLVGRLHTSSAELARMVDDVTSEVPAARSTKRVRA